MSRRAITAMAGFLVAGILLACAGGSGGRKGEEKPKKAEESKKVETADKPEEGQPAEAVGHPGRRRRTGGESKDKVEVKGHYRKDGVWVQGHERAAPGSGTGTRRKR